MAIRSRHGKRSFRRSRRSRRLSGGRRRRSRRMRGGNKSGCRTKSEFKGQQYNRQQQAQCENASDLVCGSQPHCEFYTGSADDR